MLSDTGYRQPYLILPMSRKDRCLPVVEIILIYSYDEEDSLPQDIILDTDCLWDTGTHDIIISDDCPDSGFLKSAYEKPIKKS